MKRIKIFLIAIPLFLATQPLLAQDAGWDFTVGVGIAGENVYVGSDHYYLMPLPNFKAEYAKGSFNYTVSILEGIGVTYMHQRWGLLAGVNVNVGESRNPKEYMVTGFKAEHNAKTQTLLEGTSDLNTPLTLDVSLAYLSPIGLFRASLAYHPTTVEYNEASLNDETRHGYIYSLQYMIGAQATDRLSISGLLGVDFMDRNYADTWFSVDQATSALDAFEAGGGLHSSTVGVEISYQISRRINVSLLGASTILLGDVRESPFTVETVQRTMMAQIMYQF